MRQKSTFFSISKLFVLVLTATPSPAQEPTPLPSKVQGVTVTRTSQGSYPSVTVSLRVSWSAVSGSGITYTVCYSTTSRTQSDPPSGANCGSSGITGTSTTLGPLSIGTTYYIWVAAVSSGGRGLYSDREQERTYQVPSRTNPPSLTKTVRSGKPAIGVTWTTPSSGHPITKYQVQYRPRSGSWTPKDVTSTSTTLESLSAGTSYQVRVRAVSDIGVGPYSEIETITTYRVPSQVGPPVLTKVASSGKPALTVTWTAPYSERPITKYQVLYRPRGGSWSIKNVTSTSTTLENLSAGTIYQVQVRAVSDVGSGQYSSMRTITTYRVPEQVTGVGFTLDNTNNVLTLTITWDRPSSELPITHYFVRFDKTQHQTRVVGATTLTITGTPGRNYTFSVIAVSAAGFGEWSEFVTATFPGPVQTLSATPFTVNGLPALHIRWSPPVNKAQGNLTYRLRVVPPHVTISRPVTATEFIVRGLRANTSYTVYVRAVSSGVYGPEVSILATTIGNPGPVRSLSASAIAVNGVPALRIRWRPPVNKAQGGLTYRLRVVPPHVTISRPVTATEYIVRSLRANTSYTVYVRAVSSGVYGPEVPAVGTTRGRTDFSTVSPTLIRKFTFPSRLAVVLLWSVPASVAGDVDSFVISVVMVTPSGPSTIKRSTAGTRVRAYGVYFPEKGASYQVTVHMMMNGLYSRPLTVEVNF